MSGCRQTDDCVEGGIQKDGITGVFPASDVAATQKRRKGFQCNEAKKGTNATRKQLRKEWEAVPILGAKPYVRPSKNNVERRRWHVLPNCDRMFFCRRLRIAANRGPTSIKWTTLETLSDAFLLQIHTTCGAQEQKGRYVSNQDTVIAGLQVTVESDSKQIIVRSM